MSFTQAILIVDRREGLREDLAAILGAEFPELHITSTPDAKGAETLLESAPRLGLGYLAVVIEIGLFSDLGADEDAPTGPLDDAGIAAWGDPAADGKPPQVLLRAALRGWAWGLAEAPRIFLCCEHPGHPAVVRLRQRCGSEMTASADVPRQIFLSGAEPGWERRLLHELGRLIHPRRIAARLAALEPPSAGSAFERPSDPFWQPHQGGIGNPSALRDLLRDIEEHWSYLKPRLESQVRRYFDVKVFPGGVEVTGRR